MAGIIGGIKVVFIQHSSAGISGSIRSQSPAARRERIGSAHPINRQRADRIVRNKIVVQFARSAPFIRRRQAEIGDLESSFYVVRVLGAAVRNDGREDVRLIQGNYSSVV